MEDSILVFDDHKDGSINLKKVVSINLCHDSDKRGLCYVLQFHFNGCVRKIYFNNAIEAERNYDRVLKIWIRVHNQ